MISSYNLCISIIFLGLFGCNTNKDYKLYQGEVFGTYYNFQIDSKTNLSPKIDSVFQIINQAANRYQPNSEVSKFNKTGVLINPSETFIQLLKNAKIYYSQTDGYLNPALYPLIREWGKDLTNYPAVNAEKTDSLIQISDLNTMVIIHKNKIIAAKPGVMLDFNAIGEGLALEIISNVLDSENVKNYMLEIGGEMNCKGMNTENEIWRIGIESPGNSPSEKDNSIIKIVKLHNKAISTSGSYRKFYSDSAGNKYPHIIDPTNGYPVQHNLLSVSIIANSSIEADALATACMAMGPERARSFLIDHPELMAFLIYEDQGEFQSWQTDNFSKN